MATSKEKWIRQFVISETARHKRGFTIYKVTSMIFQKSSPQAASKVFVWKRYNDFKKLHSNLKKVHGKNRIKEAYPSIAKSKIFGRFEADVIEERRRCIVKYLEFIGKYASLYTNDIFVEFFETSLVTSDEENDDEDASFADCSQSNSSDTSEDDRLKSTAKKVVSPMISTKTTETFDHKIQKFRKISPTNSANNNFIPQTMENAQGVSPTEHSVLHDLNFAPNCDSHFSQVSNENSTDESQDFDTRWSHFFHTNDKLSDEDDRSYVQKSVASLDCNLVNDAEENTARYILIAAAHISAGFRHEAMAEYDEAFMQYKLGIANLIYGIHKDPDSLRRAAVKHKIIKYSERTERLYNRHLNCNISMISKPSSELRYYKVLKIIGSMMLVKDLHRETIRVIKTVEKSSEAQDDISKYILRGKVPYMVQLHACVHTETTVFLILQYASGGKLWDFLKRRYPVPHRKVDAPDKNDESPVIICEAMIHSNSEGTKESAIDLLLQKEENLIIVTDKTENPVPVHETEFSSETCEDPAKNHVENEMSDSDQYNGDDECDFVGNIDNAPITAAATSELLEKSQKLLQSVDATIKKSNSIATRLNRPDDNSYNEKPTEKSIISNKNSNKINIIKENSKRTVDCIENAIEKEISEESGKTNSTENCIENGGKFPNSKNNLESTEEITNDLHENGHPSSVDSEEVFWKIPEFVVKSWAAQLLLTLEALHQQEVVISNLKPDNLLVDEQGQILLTYIVPRRNHDFFQCQVPYCAPEIATLRPCVSATPAADVWSFGVLLYELFTGSPFQSRHPGPLHSHSTISIPNDLSDATQLLLTKILRFHPDDRLTIPEIKQLPYFEKIDWLALLNA